MIWSHEKSNRELKDGYQNKVTITLKEVIYLIRFLFSLIIK